MVSRNGYKSHRGRSAVARKSQLSGPGKVDALQPHVKVITQTGEVITTSFFGGSKKGGIAPSATGFNKSFATRAIMSAGLAAPASFPNYFINKKKVNNSESDNSIIFEKKSFNNITDDFEIWNSGTVSNLSAFSASSGRLTTSSPLNMFNQNILTKFKTSDASVEIRIIFEMTSILNTTSYGIALGLISASTSSYKPSGIFHYKMSTGTGSGTLNYYSTSNGIPASIPSTPTAVSTTNLVPIKNNKYEFILKKDRDNIEGSVRNLLTNNTCNLKLISNMGSTKNIYLPNTSRIGIFAQGGDINVYEIIVSTLQPTTPTIACMGDSKTIGYSADNFNSAYPTALSRLLGVPISVYAGDGDTTNSIVSSISYTLSYSKPKYVILCIGRNDLNFGVETTTWQSNYSNVVSQLKSKGIIVIHLLPIPEITQSDQTTLSNWIVSTFPNDFKIDPSVGWNNLTYLSSDNIHPNSTGHYFIATTIRSALSLQYPKL